jgi:hypothetical protein
MNVGMPPRSRNQRTGRVVIVVPTDQPRIRRA